MFKKGNEQGVKFVKLQGIEWVVSGKKRVVVEDCSVKLTKFAENCE